MVGFILPVADVVGGICKSIPASAKDIEGGGVFGAGFFVEVGVAVGVEKLIGGTGLDFISYKKGLYAVDIVGHHKGVKIVGVRISRVVVTDTFKLLEGVGDGGNFGFGFVAGGFLVHSAHGGEGDAGEDRDDGDGDEQLDESEGGGRGNRKPEG